MSHESDDRTRPLSDLTANPRSSAFEEGSRVLLTRLRPKLPGGDFESVAGILLHRPVPGTGLHIRVEGKQIFVTSPVRSLATLGRDILQVSTANSVYRLEPTKAPEPEVRPAAPAADPGPGNQEPRDSVDGDATQVVSAPVPLAAPAAAFGLGACVHVTWVRGREREEYGPGHVLDAPEVGEELRLTLDRGPTLATTAIRMLRSVAPDTIELETKNTTYYLRLVAEPKPDPPRRR